MHIVKLSLLTSWTSPNAPLPITFTRSKSSGFIWSSLIWFMTLSSAHNTAKPHYLGHIITDKILLFFWWNYQLIIKMIWYQMLFIIIVKMYWLFTLTQSGSIHFWVCDDDSLIEMKIANKKANNLYHWLL